MNFKELAQRLAQEAAVNGINPATVAGQTGENKRLVDWVNDGLREILGTKLWNFLWEQTDVVVPAGANLVATTIPVSRWDKDQSYIQLPGQPERWLEYMVWDEFNANYRTLIADDGATVWSVRPDNAFILNSKVTNATSINVQRWKNPTLMSVDGDIPPLPTDLHMLIVWVALKKYAGYDEAGNQRKVAVDEIKTMTEALRQRCLPEYRLNLSGNMLLDC